MAYQWQDFVGLAEIQNACNNICNIAATDYVQCKQKLAEAYEICTAEVLSVEKETYQPKIQAMIIRIDTACKTIDNLMNAVISAANQKNSALNAEAERNYYAEQNQQ